jgi:hypothetical protein
MMELAMVTAAVGLAGVGFVAWQTRQRRRLESTMRRIPLRVGRPIGRRTRPSGSSDPR